MAAGYWFHWDGPFSNLDERGRTWTVFGSPSLQSGAAKFGPSGARLNGSTGLYVEPAAGGDFALPGEFTIEGWAKIATGAAGHLLSMANAAVGNHRNARSIWFTAGALHIYSGWDGNIITAATIPRDVYFHWAWTRDSSGVMRLFIDGVSQGTFTDTWAIDPTLVVLFSYVTAYSNNNINFTGDADEWIWDAGVCRYAANFTPPTGPFTGPATGTVQAASPLGTPALLASQQAGLVAAASPLGTPTLLASQQAGLVAAASPLGTPTLLAVQQAASLSAASPLGTATATAIGAQQFGALTAASPLGAASLRAIQQAGQISAASPFGTAAAVAWHDFTASFTGQEISRYVMDLITPSGVVRMPISSWQATLQTDASCFVQAVVPAASAHVDNIVAATEFVITRQSTLPSGQVINYEMARSPLEQIAPSQGPTNYTVVLSGYPPALTPNENPPTVQDRTLAGVRSVAGLAGSMRVRCSIDWLLRPGMRAYQAETPILVDYINYYVNTSDQYMDVGERA